MAGVLSSPNEFVEIQSLELKRGSTLKLEHAAGASVRLIDGEAWLSTCRRGERMRRGEPAALNGRGTILIYALEDSSLSLEGVEHCEVELRRRGEVCPRGSPDDGAPEMSPGA